MHNKMIEQMPKAGAFRNLFFLM